MFSFSTKKIRLGLRSKVTRVVVAALLGSLLSPIAQTTVPALREQAAAAVTNGSMQISSGGQQQINIPGGGIPTNLGNTFEAWINFSSIATNNQIFRAWTFNNTYKSADLNWSSTGLLSWYPDQMSGSQCTAQTKAPVAGTWYNLALVIDPYSNSNAGTSKVFLNGNLIRICRLSLMRSNGYIQGVQLGGSTGSAMSMSAVRISGNARYSNQSYSHTQTTTYSTSTDTNVWALYNTVYDDSNANSCLTNSDPGTKSATLTTVTGSVSCSSVSPAALTTPVNGSISLSSGASAVLGRFGGGNIDRNNTRQSPNLSYTWEGWIKFSTIAAGFNRIFVGCSNGSQTILEQCNTINPAVQALWNSTNGEVSFNACSNLTTGVVPVTDRWYHIAVSIAASSSGAITNNYFFINGELRANCNVAQPAYNGGVEGFRIGGTAGATMKIGPTRYRDGQVYTSTFVPSRTYPAEAAWYLLNTQYDNYDLCLRNTDPSNTLAPYGTIGGIATCTDDAPNPPASSLATLSGATIKGVTSTLGTPNSILTSATAGTVSLTTAQASSTSLTSTFIRSDAAGATAKIVKYSSGAAADTTNFDAAAGFTSGTTTTVSNGDYFIIKVTAENGTTINYYRINVTVPSNVATLSALALSAGTLSPTFSSGTTSYTASVANSVESGYTVTPTKSDSNATTVQYLGASGTTAFTGALAVGPNIIRTVVTAQDGTTTSTYTVTVTRLSNVATLSALALSSGTLSPAFTSGTSSYTASVANSVTSMTVTPTRTQANATITVNGTSVTSGSASGAISLSVGSNIITVVVTAQDGTTTGTYTVTVTRAALTITTANVLITAPTVGASPQTSTSSNGQFTTTITWSDSPTTFAAATAYTATVTVVPNAGYTLTGVSANFFTLNGFVATSANTANDGVFSYTFPATAPAPTITNLNQTLPNYGTTVIVTGTNLSGATAVKIGSTPVATFTVVSSTSLSFVVNSPCCTAATVSITTPGGTATSVATITPQPQLAVIATQPIAVSKNVGQSVTFSVVVTAPLDGGVLSYQWINGTTPIQGANAATFTFTPTAVTQAGNYYVAVYNTVSGSTSLVASNTAALTLNKATPVLSLFAAVNKTFGDAPFTITAPTSSVPGSFSYQSGTTSVATVDGTTITIVGQGSSVITAIFTPQNTDDYVSGGTITMTLTVAARQLATPTLPTVVVTAGTLKSFTVSWTAVSNAVAYSIRIYAADGVTLLRTVSSLSGTSKLVNATDFPTIADGTTYKVGMVATGDSNNTNSALSPLSTSFATNAQYTITYNTTNSTGGTAPAAATFITGSTPYLISANTGNLARTSFSFSGWNTAADGNGTTYLATGAVAVSPTSNLVLHPKWTALKFTVTYFGNNNTGGTAPTDSTEYLNGASATVLGVGTLVRRGYNFTGWTTDAANTSAVIAASSSRTINSASIQLYAKWQAIPYTVRYNSQGGSTVTNGSYTVGSSIALPANPTRAGHTFNGWFANSTGGTALTSPYSPPATVTNWSLIYQSTQPYRTSTTGPYVYTTGFGLGATDAAQTLLNAGRTFNKVRYRMEATYNGTLYYADVSFDKWSGGGTPSSVTPTIDKLAIPASEADAVQTNVTGCVIDSNWPGFTGVASSVTNGTGKTCRLEVWFDSYTFTTSPLLPAGTGSHDQNDTRAGSSYYGSFQVHNVTSGQIQTVMAWNKHYDPTNPDLGFGSRSGTQDTDWSFAGKTNFDLASWKLQIFIDDAATPPTEPTIGNIDLYAQWTSIPYSVTYNGNLSDGGNAPTDSTTYTVGSSIPVVGNTGALTRTGYTFSNWTLNSDGTGTVYAAGATYPVGASNVTFYARWIANLYSVTYNGTSSTGGSAPTDTSTYTIGQNVPVRGNLGSLVRTGYTFGGWTDNSGGTGTVYQSGNTYPVASSNISFHPKWTPNNYTITYNKNGASGLPTASTATYISGGDAVTLTSVGTMAKTGFNFGGWSTTSTGPAISGTYTTAADVILYAVWTIKSIAVTYSEGSATRANLTGFPSNTSGNYGTTITLNGTVSATTVIDSAQHAFMGWSDGSSVYQRGSTYLLGETSPTFTAIWAKIFAVRYAFNGGTSAAGTTDTDSECLAAGSTCTDGQVITAHAAPTRTGYTFAGWIDQNNVAVTGTTFTVASNRYLLYATWTAENYAITYNTAGGSTPEASFTKQLGQSFTVAAAPTKTGNTFTGWSDGAAVVNPGVTYNVSTSPVTLTAQWSTNVYTVSYDPNGGSGTGIANSSYTYGANAISMPTVGDLVRTNYTFAGWSETPTGTLVGATYTPIMSRTLYVVWTISQYLVTYAGNGGTPSTASATYSPGSSSLVLPTATRADFTFQGWYSAATDGVLIGLAGATYAPASATTIHARWIQDSLVGVPASSLSFISSYAVNPAITATSTFSTSDSAVSLTVPAGSLPAGTTVTNWLLSTDEYARALLPGQNNYLLSLVISWLNIDGTVPVAPESNPLLMTITNSSIKAGARVYSIVGTSVKPLGVATQDGSVSVTMTTDPQIYVLQSKPGAPTNVVATSGDQSSSVVSWNAPADDGGSAIINYTVTASDGQSCISAITTCNFGGLTNGTSYTFTVSAINGVGTSDQSAASAAITPGASVAAVIPTSPAPVAVITTGNTAGSQVATFPTGATEAIIPATVSLPATKLSFTGTAPLSLTITPLPANPVPSSAAPFTSSGSSKFVDIQVSGTFSGAVTICLDGTSIDYIFHYTSGAWVELPSRTYANGQVCAVTTNFSPFVVAARAVSTTPTVTTPSTPVAPAPVRAAFVKAQVPPQITKSAGKFVCTPGTYSSGYTLDGVVEQATTSVFSPVSYIYNLLFNLVVQSSISVTTTKNSATWDQSLAPAGSLVTCSVTVTNNSLTATESSIQNTAATSAALAAQKQSITSAEAGYKVALRANSKSYQKALVDNRAKWLTDIAQNKSTYEAERDRVKKMADSKTKNTLASAALKKYTTAQKKITADYKASGPATASARDLANNKALDAKNAAIAKANYTYSSFIESIGYGVLVP